MSLLPRWRRSMSRRKASSAATIICIIVTLLCSEPTAFAQAGSTGGTLGKTDKSLSGNESAPVPRRTMPSAKPAQAGSAARSLAGSWHWRAQCSDGTNWEAIFVATAAGSGSASLEFVGALGGKGVGTLSGSHVTLYRSFAWTHQTWSATLSGSDRMTGIITSSEGGSCTFEASR